MINVTRGNVSPSSLDTQEIRKYIDEAIMYLNDPANNAKPKKPVSYRNSDLLEQFDTIFYAKCYLTEQKFENSWTMDIEHFVPQNERPDLVYEWANLFPSDHYVNMMKPRATPAGGYLNPCDAADNVETEIIYTLSPHGEYPQFEARDPQNIKAANSCWLLDRLHNGHDDNTKKGTKSLRLAIRQKYTDILNKIIEYQSYPEDSQERYQTKRELKGLLSRESSFTMLCRSIPAVRQRLPSDFFD